MALGQIEADALVRKKQEAADRVFQQRLAKRSEERRTELEEAKALEKRREKEEEIDRLSALREAGVDVAESATQQQQQPQFALQQPISYRSDTHPSHSQTSRLLTSSLSLGVPVGLVTKCQVYGTCRSLSFSF